MEETLYETGKITGMIHGGTLRGGVSTVFGANGLSAYEVAVSEGFEGTIEEWLESIKGQAYVLTEADEEEIVQSVMDALPIYDGDYAITPKVTGQILATKHKILTQDLMIHPIPKQYGLVTYNQDRIIIVS